MSSCVCVCVCVCVDLFNQPGLTALVSRRMTATSTEGSEATRLPMIRLRATQIQLVFMVARASVAAGGAGDSSPTEIEIDVEFTRPEKRAHPRSTAAGPDLLREFVTIGHGHYEMDALVAAIFQAIATKETAQLEFAFKALDLLRFHSVADDGGMTHT